MNYDELAKKARIKGGCGRTRAEVAETALLTGYALLFVIIIMVAAFLIEKVIQYE